MSGAAVASGDLSVPIQPYHPNRTASTAQMNKPPPLPTPIYVQITPEELRRLLVEAAEEGARRYEERTRDREDQRVREVVLASKEVLTTSEAAKWVGRDEQTIRRWIAAGLPATKRRSAWRIRKEDLEAYLTTNPDGDA